MILQPPSNINFIPRQALRVFLAGSIEMDTACRWQDEAAERLSKLGFVVFNPRRKDWDSSWSQTFEDANFYQQVNWELDAIDAADLVIVYFDPKTKSPITLLELGYLIGRKTLSVAVICPEGFWRKGNVDIICHREGINQFKTIDEAIEAMNDFQIRRMKNETKI